MRKKLIFITVVYLLIFTVIPLAGASETTGTTATTTTTSFTPANLTLTATLGDTLTLNWTASSGEMPNGFKILWSVVDGPTFPIRTSDYYDTALKTDTSKAIDYFLNPGKYFARICVYDGTDACLSYSNEVIFTVAEATTDGQKSYLVDSLLDDGTGTPVNPEPGTDTPELPPAKTPFTDVSGHAYEKAIQYLQNNDIVSGYDDGTFKPDKTINRAEFTKIIIGATSTESEIESCLSVANESFMFSDTPKAEWYGKYICAAKASGSIKGYPDGTFRPDQEISFVEATKIMLLSFGNTIPEGDPWYKPFVQYMVDHHTIPQTIQSFDYRITRGEMAEMVYRLKEGIEDKPFLTYERLS